MRTAVPSFDTVLRLIGFLITAAELMIIESFRELISQQLPRGTVKII
ncbi:hypothetical protein SDC9_164779 [bioreactor metagenome]|uniref:Uncharacterized protein n=1 Tax=bioreactor metagenome TaxID=1076179 RepID=A0A645FUG6_9ZZZZ